MCDNMDFFTWVTEITDGTRLEASDRVKDITIYLQDDAHNDIANWTLFNAWPSKYTTPDFNATSSEVAFESVELVYEEMKRNQ